MRFLVLGGCGFIGAHVVDELRAAGHDVRVVSRRPEALRGPAPGVDYHLIDFRDRPALFRALAECDAVFHTISATTPGTGDLDPVLDITANLVPTVALLDLMLEARVPRLIYLSSGGMVYGMPERIPIRETEALRPINSYGIVKVAVESYVELYSRTKGLSAIILRPSNTYGERQGRDGSQGLVNTLLRRALLGETVSIWGDGSIVRDYLHVQDLARMAVLAGQSDQTGAFNVGSGVGTSVRDLIALVSETTGRGLQVSYSEARSVDAPATVLDISKARSTFGWKPEVALRDGLVRTWAWHQQLRPIV
jgi:UDP-glucose 4-epimerase